MKKQYALLAFFVIAVTCFSFNAFAQGSNSFEDKLQEVRIDRAQIESQMGLLGELGDPYPHATSYYDDKEAHYELVLMMSDEIDKGIR